MDLLALIAAEPTLLPLWAVLAFAAGLYPVGMLFSCTPCCGCSACTEGTLPETLTVTFDGYSDKTQGPDLIKLGFQSCFGSGATARVTAPGGDPETDKGPISAVSLTGGGSGYAKLGRVAPTLTASGGSGTGATFTVTVANAQDACDVDYWKVSKVTATGGSGYVTGDQLTITASEGDTVTETAVVTLVEQREPPTLAATATGGSGASLTVAITENAGSPKTWRVSGITVGSGGSGYTDGASVTITAASGDTTQAAATATIQTKRVAPTVSVVEWTVAGSGAVVTVTLAETPNWQGSGRSVWRVTAFTVVDGGSGYVEGDSFEAIVTDGVVMPGEDAICLVSSVDENGAVLAVELLDQGAYYKQGSSIERVNVSDGGIYWRTDGENAWDVQNGGIYYREDESVSPYVSPVTVTISQQSPSTGTGAELTATVDDDTASPTFGQITGVTIDDGGDGYLAWKWRNTTCCGDYWNGLSVVVKRSNYDSSNACRYAHRLCGVGNTGSNFGQVEVFYNGPTTPPTVVLASELAEPFGEPFAGYSSSMCNATFTASGNLTDCSDWSGVSFSASGGRTATVSVGGVYDPLFRNPGGLACHICCKGDVEMPAEIEANIQIEDIGPAPGAHNSGTYVLTPYWNGYQGYFPWTANNNTTMTNIVIAYEVCAYQDHAGFSADVYGCDDCHKKCRVVASIGTDSALNFPFWWFDSRRCVNKDGQLIEDQCGGMCEATPICNLSGKSFSLCLEKQYPWDWKNQCGSIEGGINWALDGSPDPSLFNDRCGAITIDIQ
jgi:hypothetical protein